MPISSLKMKSHYRCIQSLMDEEVQFVIEKYCEIVGEYLK